MHGVRVRPAGRARRGVPPRRLGLRRRRAGGFFDHATVERYPDKASWKKLKEHIDSLGLEIAGIAPGPYDLFRPPWATGSQEVYDEYISYFESYLQQADMEIPGMRVDPAWPPPYDAEYDEIWDRVADVPAPCGEGRRGRLRHAGS